MLSCETAAVLKVFADYLLMLSCNVYKLLHCSLKPAQGKSNTRFSKLALLGSNF